MMIKRVRVEEFDNWAVSVVDALMPACAENQHRAIELEIEVSGQTFLFRVWAPRNHEGQFKRQVWIKYPDDADIPPSYSYDHPSTREGGKFSGGWYLDQDDEWYSTKDRDWRRSFDLGEHMTFRRLPSSDDPRYSHLRFVSVKAVRWGSLPLTTQVYEHEEADDSFDWQDYLEDHPEIEDPDDIPVPMVTRTETVTIVNAKQGEHLVPLTEGEFCMTDNTPIGWLRAYIQLAYQPGDRLTFHYREPGCFGQRGDTSMTYRGDVLQVYTGRSSSTQEIPLSDDVFQVTRIWQSMLWKVDHNRGGRGVNVARWA